MILDDLAASTRKRIEEEKRKKSPETLRQETERLLASGFRNPAEKVLGDFPFEKALSRPGISIIAEVKKASPSKGLIAEDFPYLEIAETYAESGADAISCLTEPEYFRGSDRYLQDIAGTVPVPVLRKDFTVDPYMIYQARLYGASAVLLIAAILTDAELRDYFRLADSLGLSCLFEAHDEQELRRVLAAGARIVGVNNRNLKDFTVDIRNSVRLRRLVPDSVLFVSESGMTEPADVKVLKENGTDGVLIGEMLMRSRDRKGLIRELREV